MADRDAALLTDWHADLVCAWGVGDPAQCSEHDLVRHMVPAAGVDSRLRMLRDL